MAEEATTREDGVALRTIEAVARAATAVASELSMDRVAEAILGQLESVFGIRVAVLFLFDEASGTLRQLSRTGPGSDEILPPIGLDEGYLAAVAARTRQLQVADEPSRIDPSLGGYHAFQARFPLGGALAAPLIAFDHLVGALSCSLPPGRRFLPDEIAGLRAISQVFAVALVNARTYSAEQRMRQQLEAVAIDRARAREQLEHELDELRRAQEALRVSEERFRLTIDHAPIGMALVGLDGRFLRVNRALSEIVGYPPEELVALRFQDITHPEDLDKDLALAGKLAAGELPRYQLEKRYIRKDGTVVDIVLHGSVVRDVRGRPVYFIAQIEDITERKRAEETLRRSELRFRSIIERAPDGIMVHRDGVLVYVNPALAAVLGYGADELLGKQILDFAHPDDREVGRARLRAVKHATSPVLPLIVRFLRRDGSVLEVETSGLKVDFEGGPAALTFCRDLTARRRAERERERLLAVIEAERRWLARVLERTPTGIVLVEGSGPDPRLRANRRAEEILGRTLVPQGGPRQYVGELCSPEGSPLPLEEFPSMRGLRGEELTGEEFLVLRPDGTRLPVRGSSAPIRDPEGEILGSVTVFEDISALKEVERLREEWASVIAHDLRQPVGVINLAVELLPKLRGEAISEKEARTIERIRTAARQLSRMIDDLLDVSRLESRHLEVVQREVDLPPFVEELIERMAGVTGGHEVRLEQHGVDRAVWADPGRIEQVLGNLLSNAAKYGEPGTEIQVELEGRADEVEVTVTNRGRGIPPDELKRLFTRFARSKGSRASGIPGLGLGLYISKGLIEAHGGRLWAESTPGELTRFHFTLPLARWKAIEPPAHGHVPA